MHAAALHFRAMDLTQVAHELHRASRAAKPIPQFNQRRQLTLAEAYEVQRLLVNHRIAEGHALIGLKMGFTSVAKMQQMGVNDLIFGRLTADMLLADGDAVELHNFIHPRAEPEVCFRIARRIDRELSERELPAFVDAVACAIEVIDSRYENFKFSLEDVVADNCSSAAFAVGPWLAPRTFEPEESIELRLGQKVIRGTTADILGNPWKALQAATRLAALYREPIEAGYIVLAGAATSAEFLAGERAVSAVLGEAVVELVMV